MTQKEAVLVSAYTGFMLTKDFADIHKFCEDLLGRPIWTHEFANKEMQKEIQEKCKPMILEMIENGVTVQELDGCCRCKDTRKMTVTISNKLVDGVNTGWLGGNLPARFCPFCGRRLPQPPKGE